MSGGASRLMVVSAQQADVAAAVDCLADAFAADPLMEFLFGPDAADKRQDIVGFC